jgi:hypothetical protein
VAGSFVMVVLTMLDFRAWEAAPEPVLVPAGVAQMMYTLRLTVTPDAPAGMADTAAQRALTGTPVSRVRRRAKAGPQTTHG